MLTHRHAHRCLSLVVVYGLVTVLGAFPAATASAGSPEAKEPLRFRVSGPYVFDGLDAYLIHGPDRIKDRTLIPLHQALERKQVVVRETGTVSQLAIENLSDQEVYIQAGDIVKGGRQDRVLGTDLILPPHSGSIPIASHCVEHGRWRQRGKEEADKFHSAGSNVAHKEIKLANVRGSQAAVWENVSKLQERLNTNLATEVRSSESTSSLQLTLENERVRRSAQDYLRALTPIVEAHADAIGYAFAIDGAINSADLYASHELFLKVAPKLLQSSAVETLAERRANAAHVPPSLETILSFLTEAEHGRSTEKRVGGLLSIVRETENSVLVETREAEKGSPWIHRSSIRK